MKVRMLKERLSKAEREAAEKFGGTDDEDYKNRSEKPYFDKYDHVKRSEYHQPNHLKRKK